MSAVETGAPTPANLGRTRFRRDFAYDAIWRGHHYRTKRVDVFAVQEGDDWLVVTTIARYF